MEIGIGLPLLLLVDVEGGYRRREEQDVQVGGCVCLYIVCIVYVYRGYRRREEQDVQVCVCVDVWGGMCFGGICAVLCVCVFSASPSTLTIYTNTPLIR